MATTMRSTHLMRALTMALPAVVLAACGTSRARDSLTGAPRPASNGDDFVLVFADEFDNGTVPASANWSIETGYGPNKDGWGNNEWQLYTASRDNVRVENGNLVISARCPVAPCGVRDGTITSAKITSRGKFQFRFGKIIARIKPPVGHRAWPAFWSLGARYPDVAWPKSGEMDFMEMHYFHSDDRTTHTAMHWCDETIQAPRACSLPDGWVLDHQYKTFSGSLGDDFHVWEVDWDANSVVAKVDGETYFTRTIDPATMEEFLNDFFLILNVAMGGTLGSGGGPPDGSETFPQTMLVDYVRVFQRSPVQAGRSGARTPTTAH